MKFKLMFLILLTVGCKSSPVEHYDNTLSGIKKLAIKDTLNFNLDTIQTLSLPLFVNVYSLCEDSIIGKKTEIVKRKVLNGYKVFGKIFTKDDKYGIITTEPDNAICLNICNKEGKLISKTVITPIISIPRTQFLIGKYFMITSDFEIEAGVITGDCAIDKDSIFLATIISEANIEKYKIDSNGQLMKIKVIPNNIIYK